MKGKKKRILLLSLIMFFTLSLTIFAKTIYDMQKINPNVVKPISGFEIIYERPNGEKGSISSNSKFYDSDVYTFDQKPNKITLECGSKIKIKDVSKVGDGSKISWYDFQMYTPSHDNLIYTKNKNEFEIEYTLDEAGLYSFYLSVMDNNENIAGYDNWSINGNHRWLAENKNNRTQMFYWYFSQADVYVLDKDEIIDDEEGDEGVDDEEEIIDLPDASNNAPEVKFSKPQILYPKEITQTTGKTNRINFIYYDEDDDPMESASYAVYDSNKNLIANKDDIKNNRDMYVDVEGDMNEELTIVVTVKDTMGDTGRNTTTIKINEFFPDAKIINDERVYLNDYLTVSIVRNEIDELKKLKINYNEYKIYDENNVLIDRGTGCISNAFLVDAKKYKENKFYKIEQKISNSYGTSKIIRSEFYVVEIEKPIVHIAGGTLNYGEKINVETEILQPQSRLKGSLKDYVYNFTDEDCNYEIIDCESNKIIYSSKGLIEEFIADSNYGIRNVNYDKTYKVVVKATNGAGKTGEGYAYYAVKNSNKEYVQIKIKERDDDLTTKHNQIYCGESLLIETSFNNPNKLKEKFYIKDTYGNIYYETDHYINGLFKIDLKPGEYYIVALLYNEDRSITSSDEFLVKEIEKPIITMNDVKESYTKLDTLNLNTKVIDINRSEEHPNGFELINSYSICNEEYSGIINDVVLKDYGIFNICQNSINAEHTEVANELSKDINVINIIPTIECTSSDKYFAGEIINFDVIGNDIDGYISSFNISNISDIELNDYEEIDKKINEKTWIKQLKFIANKTGVITFKFEATDDYGDTTILYINVSIADGNFYPYFYSYAIDKDNLKENRYINAEYGAINADSYYLMFEGQTIELKNINDVFENDFVKIILEEITDRKKIGMYFKKEGKYIFKTIAKKDNFVDIERDFVFDISEDLLPSGTIKDEIELYRSNEDNIARMNEDIEIFTDDQIKEMDLIVDDEFRTCLLNDKLKFDFNKNELGEKKVKILLYETHSYMPAINHPFYNELSDKMLKAYSNEMIVNIENIKPTIKFDSYINTYKLKFIN